MRRLTVLVPAILMAVTALTADGSAREPSAGRLAERTVVEAAGGPALLFRWEPASVTISRGDKVTWTNPTGALHHVTGYDGPWTGTLHLDSGETVTKRFKKPGVYSYYCDIVPHAVLVAGQCVGMCGTVTVE